MTVEHWVLSALLACVLCPIAYVLAKRRAAHTTVPAPARRLTRAEVLAVSPADIVARPASDGDQTMYWIRSLIVPVLFQAESHTEDRDAPAVVLRLPDRDVMILRTGTLHQAEARAHRYRREMREIGPEAFCARHALARDDTDRGAVGDPA